eukprot:3992166-Alexandrium_andersonii.AAC.1
MAYKYLKAGSAGLSLNTATEEGKLYVGPREVAQLAMDQWCRIWGKEEEGIQKVLAEEVRSRGRLRSCE